ncbi:HEPN domain-containing protein [Nitrosomonas sp. ANs5]|uniref:HEPN domain-containing protein n=1 Tax=Nitrosomonas sp. ANs5 TaxID=3423941 RepID=UPI003D345A42
MDNIIDSYFIQHKQLSDFLLEKKEISLKSDADRRFAKVLILATASYFEERIITALSDYSDALLNGDEKISSLLKIKALERQYHTLFDWKENNANRFFSHFGENIKKKHKEDVSQNEIIRDGEKMFMTLGRMRNVLVHTNFAVTPIDKTHEEIYTMFRDALRFVDYVEEIFRVGS